MQSQINQNIYIQEVYTKSIHNTKLKMSDIFENKILCNSCNKEMNKTSIVKDGFQLRVLQCPKCNKLNYHPLDLQDYENFKKIKNKQFQVKLRYVGNSYTVSIPREIIEFQEEIQKEINEILYLSLEEPEKLSIFFNKKLKRLMEQ